MAILLFVHLTRHSSTASEQLSCISPVPAHHRSTEQDACLRPPVPIASSACIRATFSRARPDEEAKWRASRAKAIRQGNIEENDVGWIAFLVALTDRRKRVINLAVR